MHAVWCISVLQIHQIHQYCKCVLDNWQLLVLHGRFLQFSMYHTDAPLWYHSDFEEGVICQSISVLIAACDCRGMVLKVKTWQISENPTSGQTEGREWGMQACPTNFVQSWSFLLQLHKYYMSRKSAAWHLLANQNPLKPSEHVPLPGTWCALQPPCVYGFSLLWNNNIYVQCVLHTSLSQYTSCSVMWWLMRRGVNMLTANELAAAAPSSLSLISLFRFQPSTLFRVYLLSRKIVQTPAIQSPPPSGHKLWQRFSCVFVTHLKRYYSWSRWDLFL